MGLNSCALILLILVASVFSACQPGYERVYVSGNNYECRICPSGSYSNTENCQSCSGGHYCPSPGMSSPTPCPEGMQASNFILLIYCLKI